MPILSSLLRTSTFNLLWAQSLYAQIKGDWTKLLFLDFVLTFISSKEVFCDIYKIFLVYWFGLYTCAISQKARDYFLLCFEGLAFCEASCTSSLLGLLAVNTIWNSSEGNYIPILSLLSHPFVSCFPSPNNLNILCPCSNQTKFLLSSHVV